MSEENTLVHVARGVQPTLADTITGVVDNSERFIDMQPVTRRQTDVIQAEVLRVGRAPGRDENLVSVDRRAVGERQMYAVCSPTSLSDLDVQVKRHTRSTQSGRHMFTGERLHPRQQPALRNERHLRAERTEGGGHLGADDPATDDGQPRRDVLYGGRLAARPRCHVRQPADGWNVSAAAGGDHDRLACLHGGRRTVRLSDGDSTRPSDASVAADQVDAGVVQPLDLAGVAPVGGESVAPGEHRGWVQIAADGLAGSRQCASGAEGRGVAEQGLGRHAGPVRALAADELVFDDRRRQAALHYSVGDILSDRSATDDHDVEELLRHVSSPSQRGAADGSRRSGRRCRPGSRTRRRW
jgi:hypothetical protein